MRKGIKCRTASKKRVALKCEGVYHSWYQTRSSANLTYKKQVSWYVKFTTINCASPFPTHIFFTCIVLKRIFKRTDITQLRYTNLLVNAFTGDNVFNPVFTRIYHNYPFERSKRSWACLYPGRRAYILSEIRNYYPNISNYWASILLILKLSAKNLVP